MSTSYGLSCPEHDQATSAYCAQGSPGRDSLAAIWRVRESLRVFRESPVMSAIISGHEWLGVEDAHDVEDFVIDHRHCNVEIVSEYGDRELPDDALNRVTEPDADEIVRIVLRRLEFPDDAIDRTCHAIVDALDATRILNNRRRPERLRGGV